MGKKKKHCCSLETTVLQRSTRYRSGTTYLCRISNSIDRDRRTVCIRKAWILPVLVEYCRLQHYFQLGRNNFFYVIIFFINTVPYCTSLHRLLTVKRSTITKKSYTKYSYTYNTSTTKWVALDLPKRQRHQRVLPQRLLPLHQ